MVGSRVRDVHRDEVTRPRSLCGVRHAEVHQTVVRRPAGEARSLGVFAAAHVLPRRVQHQHLDGAANDALVLLEADALLEGVEALERADALIITRKRASLEVAEALRRELGRRVAGPAAIAHLGLRQLVGLVSGRPTPASDLAGRRVVAAAGIADPDAFVAQLKGTGAQVQVATWKDHHDYRDEDLAWLAHAARRADHVVTTEKDAVKLRDRWPANVPEPLVAILGLEWEVAGDEIVSALDAAVQRRT